MSTAVAGAGTHKRWQDGQAPPAALESSWAARMKERYALQRVARRWLCEQEDGRVVTWLRLNGCNRLLRARNSAANKGVDLYGDPGNGQGHFRGLQHCASPWACTVCSSTIWDMRRREIAEALDVHRHGGKGVLFITLTASHHNLRLGPFLDKLAIARRKVYKDGSFSRFKEAMGYVGAIATLEIPWSDRHGWHPHSHMLWLVDTLTPGLLAEITAFLNKAWRAALVSVGLSASIAHGVVVKDSSWDIEQYLTKMGHDRSWDLDAEMTMGSRKVGREEAGMTAFDLLRIDLETRPAKVSKGRAFTLFVEYAHATRHHHSLRWSPGLRRKLGLAEPLSNKEIMNLGEHIEQDPVLEQLLIYHGRLPADDWKIVLDKDKRAELRIAIGRCDGQHLTQFLRGLGIRWTPQTGSSPSNPQFGQVIPKHVPPTPEELAARGSPWPQPQPHTYPWYDPAIQ